MGNQPSLTAKQYEANRASMQCGKEKIQDSPNAQMIGKFHHAYNRRDRKFMQSKLGEGAKFSFKGGEACLPLDMFIEQVDMVQDSFPDVYNSWDDISETEPGVVRVSHLVSQGTHTGKPFAYGPFPAVPPAGKVVHDGPSVMTYLIENGKIKHLEMEASPGALNGPPAYYTQIGGKITMTA